MWISASYKKFLQLVSVALISTLTSLAPFGFSVTNITFTYIKASSAAIVGVCPIKYRRCGSRFHICLFLQNIVVAMWPWMWSAAKRASDLSKESFPRRQADTGRVCPLLRTLLERRQLRGELFSHPEQVCRELETWMTPGTTMAHLVVLGN